MVRAPCCEKMGLKKGPWTAEEDKVLISHIQKYGHSNWRALPKQAGLLRCGKSCRLRWINYLRPDIKRGNFTEEEEETIIKLHEMLGNRWSAIAVKLPGRTDNEIKNVWHTHLKKKLKQRHDSKQQNVSLQKRDEFIHVNNQSESKNSNILTPPGIIESPGYTSMSPRPSSSDLSSITDTSTATGETSNINTVKTEKMESSEEIIFPVIDEYFWSDPELVIDNCSISSSNVIHEVQFKFPTEDTEFHNIDDVMDFWYSLFVKSGGEEELL